MPNGKLALETFQEIMIKSTLEGKNSELPSGEKLKTLCVMLNWLPFSEGPTKY
jgi:hypothetical protein